MGEGWKGVAATSPDIDPDESLVPATVVDPAQ